MRSCSGVSVGNGLALRGMALATSSTCVTGFGTAFATIGLVYNSTMVRMVCIGVTGGYFPGGNFAGTALSTGDFGSGGGGGFAAAAAAIGGAEITEKLTHDAPSSRLPCVTPPPTPRKASVPKRNVIAAADPPSPWLGAMS